MEMSEAIRRRVSERSYTKDRMPFETLKELIAAAQEAPSACNLQLTEYVIVDDPKLLEVFAKKVSGKFAWASTYVFLVYDSRFTIKRHAGVVSLGASAENLMLAATDRGLATCPMAGFDRDDIIKKALQIPDHYQIGLAIAIGYAATDSHKQRIRVPAHTVTHHNTFIDHQTMREDWNIRAWSIREIISYRERIAPVYLYGERANLQSFPRVVYTEAARICGEVCGKYNPVKILDLHTYDGAFISVLKNLFPTALYTCADYTHYVRAVIQRQHAHAQTVQISETDVVAVADATQDLVTFVHKAWFVPRVEIVCKEACRVLKPGGHFFLTLPRETFKERASFFLRRIFFWRETGNVYEKNPYYKIGPWHFVSARQCAIEATRAGFSLSLEGSLSSGSWMLYEKK